MSEQDIDLGFAPLSTQILAEQEWQVLDRKRVLRHFDQSLHFERIDIYLQDCTELLPNEKVILFWLAKTYTTSLSTVQLYARYLVQFLNYACKDFHAITHIDVDAFLRHLRLAKAKPATLQTVGATLKSFFRVMVDARFMEHNPTAFIKKSKKQKEQTLAGHLSHSLSHDEIETLLAYMETRAPLRDYAMLLFLYTTGLRATEACDLTWRHIVNWQENWYADIVGKGAKARRVYIPLRTMRTLMEYRQITFHVPAFGNPRFVADMPVFPHQRNKQNHLGRHGMYRIVKHWIFMALGKNASPHWMRHSCFTQQRLRGASLESIQAGAGHTSIETTMQYNEAAALMAPAGKVFDDENNS